MDTKILKIDTVEPQQSRIKEAARIVKSGGIVVFPTETVYGIGANAFDAKACANIFKAKGRPSDNPLIVTVCSLEQAEEIAEIPSQYIDTIKKLWPSPITFIVKAKAKFPKEVTAGLDTIAIRMPAHPVALSLIKEAGVPIAAPSANPSKKPTATSGSQCIKYFGGKVDCIIDSDEAFFGIESTILDLRTFTLLRPGPFTQEELKKVFGKEPTITKTTKGKQSEEIAISPGTKYAHYAPDTLLFLFEGKIGEMLDTIAQIENMPHFVFIGSSESCKLASEELGCSTIDLGKRSEPFKIAKNLYDSLIMLDSFKVKLGIIEAFDENGIGLAIMNRIRKASSHSSFSDSEGLLTLLIAEGLKS